MVPEILIKVFETAVANPVVSGVIALGGSPIVAWLGFKAAVAIIKSQAPKILVWMAENTEKYSDVMDIYIDKLQKKDKDTGMLAREYAIAMLEKLILFLQESIKKLKEDDGVN